MMSYSDAPQFFFDLNDAIANHNFHDAEQIIDSCSSSKLNQFCHFYKDSEEVPAVYDLFINSIGLELNICNSFIHVVQYLFTKLSKDTIKAIVQYAHDTIKKQEGLELSYPNQKALFFLFRTMDALNCPVSYSKEERKIIIKLLSMHINELFSVEQLIKIYNTYVDASFIEHHRDGCWAQIFSKRYSATKIKFIELIQCKILDLKRVVPLSNEKVASLLKTIFSIEHNQNGVPSRNRLKLQYPDYNNTQPNHKIKIGSVGRNVTHQDITRLSRVTSIHVASKIIGGCEPPAEITEARKLLF